MLFSEIIGQDTVKEQLLHMARQGRVGHALLFTGAEGVGGLSLALAFAQYLYCRSPKQGDACGECPECYRMQRFEHPDCHYIYPVNASKEAVTTGRADDKPRSEQFLHLWREAIPATGGYLTEQAWYRTLGIENQQGNINKTEANELVRQMGFKSFEGGYKMAVVWLPERLQEAAANTLLKLIEEPPPNTLFLLVSVEPEKILATVRSRTQIISLAALPEQTVAEALIQRLGTAPERAAQLAHLSQGSWSEALSLAIDAEGSAAEHQERFIALMRLCYSQKYLDLFDWAEEMAPLGRENQKQFCIAGLGILRECYLTGIGLERLSYADPSREAFCRNFAPYVNHLTLEAFVREFELLLAQIRQNGNPRILFTHFAMTLSKILGHARSRLAAG